MTNELQQVSEQILDAIQQSLTLARSMKRNESGDNGPSHILMGIAHRLLEPFETTCRVIVRLTGGDYKATRAVRNNAERALHDDIDEVLRRHLGS